MKISPIMAVQIQPKRNNNIKSGTTAINNTARDSISFRGQNVDKAWLIERNFSRKKIEANFEGNSFVAECCSKIAKAFESIFDSPLLPRKIKYDNSICGRVGFDGEILEINSDFDKQCFKDMNAFVRDVHKNRKKIAPEWKSEIHPAHIFVTEFARAAWHRNIEKQTRDSYFVKEDIYMTGADPACRLINKFGFMDFKANEDKDNLESLMVNRITQDIVKDLDKDTWELKYETEIPNYSNIFMEKWGAEFSCPEAYLDNLLQQVWNGNTKGIEKGIDKIREFLGSQPEEVKPKSFWERLFQK